MPGRFSESVPPEQQVNFTCNSCGNCCKDLIVNLKFNDIAKIIEKRSNLQINDFVEFIDEDEDYPYGIKGNLFGKQVPVLKKKNGSCVFLSDRNLCTINDFKPLTCKIFPFKLEHGGPVWESKLINFLNTKCGYTLESNPVKKDQIMQDLLENEKISQSFLTEITNKNNLQKQEYLADLSSCLSGNLEFNNESKIYELSSLENPLSEKFKGTKTFSGKSYFSSTDILGKEEYQKFSHLIFSHVLENTRNPAEFTGQLYKSVTLSQPVIFIVKNNLNPLFAKFIIRPAGITYNYLEKPGIKELNYFSLKSLKKLLSENGFFIKNVFKYQQDFSTSLRIFSDIFKKIIEQELGKTVIKDFEEEKNSFSYIIVAYKMK
jgi:Fe-S-cluster containining protein